MKIMNIRAVVLVFFLLFTTSLYARAKTDVLVMKNGDRLTCEVKGLEGGVLYVKLDYVDGTLSVQWSKVVRIESSRLFLVKTQSGSVYTGSLSTAEAPGDQPVKVEVAESPEKKVLIDGSQITGMAQTSDKFWQRFNGEISMGLIYSKGNQSTQYNLSSDANYPRDRWAADVSFNSNLSASNGVKASTRNQLDLGAFRLLRWNNYFYAGGVSFLQANEQGIGLQTNFGGGIGRYLKNTIRAKITMLGGFAWQHTRYNEPITTSLTQNVTAAMITTEVKVFKFKKTNLDLKAVLFPAISEPGRVFFKTNDTYYIKIFKNLSWNLSFYGNWDNRPPGHLSGSDYGSSSGLSWTFGNR